MGASSLRDKIKSKLEQSRCREEDVLYLLVEIGKLLERSNIAKLHLGDPAELKLNAQNYPVILFFRNWAAHAEKERGEIPGVTRDTLYKACDGSLTTDDELFRPLIAELSTLAGEIDADIHLSPEEFVSNLKCILSEQPVVLPKLKKRVVFDGAQTLIVL